MRSNLQNPQLEEIETVDLNPKREMFIAVDTIYKFGQPLGFKLLTPVKLFEFLNTFDPSQRYNNLTLLLKEDFTSISPEEFDKSINEINKCREIIEKDRAKFANIGEKVTAFFASVDEAVSKALFKEVEPNFEERSKKCFKAIDDSFAEIIQYLKKFVTIEKDLRSSCPNVEKNYETHYCHTLTQINSIKELLGCFEKLDVQSSSLYNMLMEVMQVIAERQNLAPQDNKVSLMDFMKYYGGEITSRFTYENEKPDSNKRSTPERALIGVERPW